MAGPADVLWTLFAGVLWWYAGAVFFDLVHFALHAMLRSRSGLLRALAWPHSVHHAWIDRQLEVRWEKRTRNVFCHIVPEYGTQLAFAGAVAWVQPVGVVAVLVALQTLVFAVILSYRGLDPNHRPIAHLDAYRPGFLTPPAYHALHHVHPDAYYSAYTKWIDALVAGAAQIAGRRFAFAGPDNAFAEALRARLVREGAVIAAAASAGEVDVWVRCEPDAAGDEEVERFIASTRGRKLPPECWRVHGGGAVGRGRHYLDDPRVSYRALLVPDAAVLDAHAAERAAAVALGAIRRGFHAVPTAIGIGALRSWWAFRRAPALAPAGVALGRRRDLARAIAPANGAGPVGSPA